MVIIFTESGIAPICASGTAGDASQHHRYDIRDGTASYRTSILHILSVRAVRIFVYESVFMCVSAIALTDFVDTDRLAQDFDKGSQIMLTIFYIWL